MRPQSGGNHRLCVVRSPTGARLGCCPIPVPAVSAPSVPPSFARGAGLTTLDRGESSLSEPETCRSVGRGGGTGLSARALRARPTAHLPPVPHGAAHALLRACPPHRLAAPREMRRGGSRREPALSPVAAVGDTCHGHSPAFFLHTAQPPRTLNKCAGTAQAGEPSLGGVRQPCRTGAASTRGLATSHWGTNLAKIS